MAKKKVGSCDGECQAYKNLKVEVHEPDEWDDEMDSEFIDELMNELDDLETQLENGFKLSVFLVAWNLFVTGGLVIAVCTIF